MYSIKKQFDFCYGHRVWSQNLDQNFSVDNKCKCRHLHGHQGVIIVELKSDELKNGMVTDFKHLNWFKKWLDDVFDHKFIMDLNDPLLRHEIPLFEGCEKEELFDYYLVDDLTKSGAYVIGEDYLKDVPDFVKEKNEGMVFVDFVPTSENLSKFFFTVIEKVMKLLDIKVSSVQFFETPKSQSTYYE